MTEYKDPRKAARDLDSILFDMEEDGNDPRRAARRIRAAVDCLLLGVEESTSSVAQDLGVDVPPVSELLADQLVVHHLSLAAAYYEASGPGLELTLARARGANKNFVGISLPAERAWLRVLERAYNDIDRAEVAQEEKEDYD